VQVQVRVQVRGMLTIGGIERGMEVWSRDGSGSHAVGGTGPTGYCGHDDARSSLNSAGDAPGTLRITVGPKYGD